MIESCFLEDNEKILRNLKKIPTFEPFGDKDLRSLLKRSKLRKYLPGETIIKEGVSGSWVYFLVYGEVAIVQQGRTVTSTDRQGELMGEMGAIDGARRSATVVAQKETVCLATDTRQIKHLAGYDRMAYSYILYRVFAEVLADRLRATTRELIRERAKFSLIRWQPQLLMVKLKRLMGRTIGLGV
jgi:CRP-like cAMP-binding protein